MHALWWGCGWRRGLYSILMRLTMIILAPDRWDPPPNKFHLVARVLSWRVLYRLLSPNPDTNEVLIHTGWVILRLGVVGATEAGTGRGGWCWWCWRGMATPWFVDRWRIVGWYVGRWRGVWGARGRNMVGVRTGSIRHHCAAWINKWVTGLLAKLQ